MTDRPDILCIGSVLWDVIGRSPAHMAHGADVPGRIVMIPGGVALNIAMTLARLGMRPSLLSAVGRDAEGDRLVADCAGHGIETAHLYRSEDLRTDRYMAVEGANGLIAAIADAHSLEEAGDKILRPLHDGALATPADPWDGIVALDGNLTEALLAEIAAGELLRAADLRIAPASPGKAERLLPFLRAGRGTLYVNLEEAGLLCARPFATAEDAARGLCAAGAARAVVTDGARDSCDADARAVLVRRPPEVLVTRVTGAGDTFMAAHIAAERSGTAREDALARAQAAAAAFVSGDHAT